MSGNTDSSPHSTDNDSWNADEQGIVYIEGPWGIVVWGKEYEDRFLNELKFARKFVPLHRDAVILPILREISTILTYAFAIEYSVGFLLERFSELKERYNLFGYVLAFPSVWHNKVTNKMRMPREIAAAIQHDNYKAEKYLLVGDPLWDDLKFLFDSPYGHVHDSGVFFHPSSIVERIDFSQLQNIPGIPNSHALAAMRYCEIFNGVYRHA